MAADIFQFLIDILKISPNLVSEYAAQGVFYQIFYLFLFPTIFVIIFVWILTNKIMGQHKGLRILLSVAVYAFIILQGYYTWFVMFSKYWLVGLITLGFFYFISYRGGGGAKAMTGGGRGILSSVFNQVNPLGEFRNEADMVKTNINFIFSKVSEDKKQGRAGHYEEIINETHRTIDDLAKKAAGGRKNPEIDKMKRNLEKAMEGKSPQW
jgi:hypothetical protein